MYDVWCVYDECMMCVCDSLWVSQFDSADVTQLKMEIEKLKTENENLKNENEKTKIAFEKERGLCVQLQADLLALRYAFLLVCDDVCVWV